MLIIMDVHQLQPLQMDKELFQEVHRAKLESGRSQSKLKLCRLL